MGPGGPSALRGCPPQGWQPGRGGATEAPRARPSSKCPRTCHPSRPRSIFPSRRGRGTRARTGGRSWAARGGRWPGSAGVPQPQAAGQPPPSGPQSFPHCPRPPRAPPTPRAPAPTRGRGSRRRARRRRHNNINTAGPPARPCGVPRAYRAAQRTATGEPAAGTGAVRAVAAAVTQRCPRLGFWDRVVRPRSLR